MSRFGPQFEHIFGKGEEGLEKIFPEGSPSSVTPWGTVTRSRLRHDYDKEAVMEALKQPHLTQIDPRTVKATQPMITRAGVRHYMQPEAGLYKDTHLLGNQHPVVYHRGDTSLLLSGHHRATAALLQGKQFEGIEVHGDWGPPR